LGLAIVLHKWHLRDIDAALVAAKKTGADKIVVFVNWSCEREAGAYDFSEYKKYCDKIVDYGLKIIFRIQCTKSVFYNYEGKPLFIQRRIYPIGFKRSLLTSDHLGHQRSQLDFCERSMALLEAYYSQAVEYFSKRYNDSINSFALAISEENEIKFGQNKYGWRPYSDLRKGEFVKIHGNEPPVINSPRKALSPHKLKPIPLFHEFMIFREEILIQTISALSKVVRAQGHKTMGMFGQFFQSHDGIFCSRVISKLVPYLDCVTVDYNFYNGWDNVYYDVAKPSLMANLARNLGYKEISIGLYLERARIKKNESERNDRLESIDTSILQHLSKVREFTGKTGQKVDYEFAGFGVGLKDLETLQGELIQFSRQSPEIVKSEKVKIAILACHSNYDFFVGDRLDNNHSFIRNNLSNCYKSFVDLGCIVDIISDTFLESNPSILDNYRAVIAPTQFAVTQKTLDIVNNCDTTFISDQKFAKFDENGYEREKPLELGITAVNWEPLPLKLANGIIISDYSNFPSLVKKVPAFSTIQKNTTVHLKIPEKQRGFFVMHNNKITTGLSIWSLKDETVKTELMNLLIELFAGSNKTL